MRKKGEGQSREMRDEKKEKEKAGCRGRAVKPGAGWDEVGVGGRSDGVGYRGGVKTHLFLQGCEFRLERRVAWGARRWLVVINQQTPVEKLQLDVN